MPLAPTKTQVRSLIPVLEAEYETVEDAAQAVMAAAWEVYEARSKWGVVGWVVDDDLGPESGVAEGRFVILGGYATETNAWSAQQSFAGNGWMCYPAPMWYGTPFQFFKERKAVNKRLAKKDGVDSIAQALQRRRAWFEANPRTDLPHDIDAEDGYEVVSVADLLPGDQIIVDGWLRRTVAELEDVSGARSPYFHVRFDPELHGSIYLQPTKAIQRLKEGAA